MQKMYNLMKKQTEMAIKFTTSTAAKMGNYLLILTAIFEDKFIQILWKTSHDVSSCLSWLPFGSHQCTV